MAFIHTFIYIYISYKTADPSVTNTGEWVGELGECGCRLSKL